MDYEIIRIDERSWRIEDGGVRFFLLEGAEKALLIDTGMSGLDARGIARSLTDRPVALLNTHADRDHVGANAQFDRCLMHPAEAEHYAKSGVDCTIVPVNDGDVIDIGGRPLRIIHLPGHTPGSIAVLDENARVLISGDPIQTDGRIFMFGGHRNMGDYIASLERLAGMEELFDEIWPSHATIPVPVDTIDRLIAGARDIVAGRITGKETDFHGQTICVCDLGFTVMLCDA